MEPSSSDAGGTAAGITVPETVPDVRGCTRCEGEQHLVGSARGFGKYRCIRCGLIVGFDLEATTVEFLLDRGSPGRYTSGLFGSRLLGSEQRLP